MALTKAKLLEIDGTGSGVDADLLDGSHGTSYLKRTGTSNGDADSFDLNTVNLGTANTNAPDTGWWLIMTLGGGNNRVQFAYWIYKSYKLYVREDQDGTWTAWKYVTFA